MIQDYKSQHTAYSKTVFPAISLRFSSFHKSFSDGSLHFSCIKGFLGNRYGYRPFPPVIRSSEFEVLRELIEGDVDSETLSLLDEWFLQDANAVPPVHVLQPITTKLENFNNEENPDLQRQDKSKWWKVFEKIQKTLQLAAAKAKTKGVFDAQRMHKYFQSGKLKTLWFRFFSSDRMEV